MVIHHRQMDVESWFMAEKRIEEILRVIQPTVASDKTRKEVVDYVRKRLRSNHEIGARVRRLNVFSFGSVPLKTYLPDGDIDVTILSDPTKEEDLAGSICDFFEYQEFKSCFQITGVIYINAKVKVVKCRVNKIAVDISFNQPGGLSALCFMEHVDQLVGREHIFKRSIILVKAWCYYEARILGSHNGLLSTYALEVMILHILNLFNSSLQGPLAVLYKFLEYYSSFDWINNAISVGGSVPISTLLESSANSLETGGHGSMFTPEFLHYCRNKYLVSDRDAIDSGFQIKDFNIVDPLKHTNNLGRSVSKGNSERIILAFSHGAAMLREILMLPGETMGAELESFFANSLNRNGKGERLDVNGPVSVFGTGRSEISQLQGDYVTHYSNFVYSKQYRSSDMTDQFVRMFPDIARHYGFTMLDATNNNQNYALADPSQNECREYDFHQMCIRALVLRNISSDPYMSNLRPSRGIGTFIPDANHPSIRERNAHLNSTEYWSLREIPRMTYRGESSLHETYFVSREMFVSNTLKLKDDKETL